MFDILVLTVEKLQKYITQNIIPRIIDCTNVQNHTIYKMLSYYEKAYYSNMGMKDYIMEHNYTNISVERGTSENICEHRRLYTRVLCNSGHITVIY